VFNALRLHYTSHSHITIYLPTYCILSSSVWSREELGEWVIRCQSMWQCNGSDVEWWKQNEIHVCFIQRWFSIFKFKIFLVYVGRNIMSQHNEGEGGEWLSVTDIIKIGTKILRVTKHCVELSALYSAGLESILITITSRILYFNMYPYYTYILVLLYTWVTRQNCLVTQPIAGDTLQLLT